MGILISEHTRILVQGITGREAANFTRDLMDYGMTVVAGITPGKGGMSVHGIPVFDTVAETIKLGPDASIISVPPRNVWEAATEAIEQGIGLLVIVTEGVPRKDVFRIIEAAEEKGTTVLGPNSLGAIIPCKAKIGMIGGPAEDAKRTFTPGPVGIISRSGGMIAEIANTLTLAGIGQSTCISIGGDPIVCTGFGPLLQMFENDLETEVVVLFTEPGGGALEKEVADLIRLGCVTKPVVALVAGRFADEMPGVRFGHAGAIVDGDSGSTRSKCRILKQAGVIVVEEVEGTLAEVRRLLAEVDARGPISGDSR
jgi:succinyl-CoA synthetase alpha subunit